ncbi:MAG: LysR family transcriptional regulator [Methyloprofundus sp.]|nr:LysR family transcriptional regulator [Methyloprofundus sp.]
MSKLKEMQVFCRIVELGTFVAVAREKQVSAMMISKYIKQLESDLGVTLINRQTRKLQITEIGKKYYQQCKKILEDINSLESSISQLSSNVKGILRINAPIDFGGLYMVPVIDEYQKKYPEVEVLMSLDNAEVDLSAGMFDISIVVTDILDEGVVARKIAQTSLCTYASPKYIKTHGEPFKINDLLQHKCLHYLGTPHGNSWIFDGKEGRVEISPQWVFASNNGRALCQAAALGMGVVRSPALSVKPYVVSGELVEILADYQIKNLSVYATYLQRNYYPAKMSSFLDFLVAYFTE